MKKAWHDPRVIFTALQVCSVIALLPVPVALEAAVKGLIQGEGAVFLQLVIGAGLWGWMWLSFLRMCGRLKREPSAFTRRNARTLRDIAVCCGLLGVIEAIEAIRETAVQARGVMLGGWLGTLATVVMLFGVAGVALVLRHLLMNAMALQQDSDLTI